MAEISIPPGSDFVRLPSIEEADILAPAHDAIEKLREQYAGRAEALRALPPREQADRLRQLQREYLTEAEPITRAAADGLARLPMTWLVVPPKPAA